MATKWEEVETVSVCLARAANTFILATLIAALAGLSGTAADEYAVSASPTRGHAPLRVTYQIRLVDPSYVPVRWKFIVEENATIQIQLSASGTRQSSTPVAASTAVIREGTGAPPSSISVTLQEPAEYLAALQVWSSSGWDGFSWGDNVEVLPEDNRPPDPGFTYSPTAPVTGEPVVFDASSSSDDGSIERYKWSFHDDMSHADGVVVTHTYADPGRYSVKLSVTDDDGDTQAETEWITVESGNAPPVAGFTLVTQNAVTGDPVQFSMSGSADADGRIVWYGWDWESDGVVDHVISEVAQGSEYQYAVGWNPDGTYEKLTPSLGMAEHTFGAAGRFTVTLHVRDDDGAEDETSAALTVAAPNLPPRAGFTASPAKPVVGIVEFDASTSSDTDGDIESYAWDYGDGRSGTGKISAHRYTESGIYLVALTVTDDGGASRSFTTTVHIRPANETPVAHFTWRALSLSGARLSVEPRLRDRVEFDASTSSDAGGRIVEFGWDWESDGTFDATTPDPVIEHTFSATGEMHVTLRVTDDEGASDVASGTLTIGEAPIPVASFTFSPQALSILDDVTFTDTSSHPEGEIVAWQWTFGDGATSEERNPAYRYQTKGSFVVSLTVTDAEGESASMQHELLIVNVSPKATFTISPDRSETQETVRLDASASSDPDGEIATYAWDVDEDGTSDTKGSVVDWIFNEAGTHRITLAVTDEDGATSTSEQLITVEAPPEIVEPREVWALVVGISDYEEVRDLEFARADGESFAEWLLEADVPEDHVEVLYDGEATLTKVRAGLGWLRRMAQPDDLAFVFFAGHGFQSPDDDADEEDGFDEFLVLADTVGDAVDDTALRDDEFGRFLDRVKSDHVMVVFDSCYSGGQSRSLSGGARPLGDTFDLLNDFSLEGKLVFAAASEDQLALEDPDLGHGIFTHFLIEGLRGTGDLDQDFMITAGELGDYVSAQVERYAREQLGQDQTPEMRGRGNLGIVLATADRPPQPRFAVTPDIPYAWGMTRFLDTSEDDGRIVAWAWSLGDGATSDEQNPTHVYEEPGAYTIALTATDDEGRASTSRQEVVIAHPGDVTVVAGETIIISLGSANGVRAGDRFEIVRVLELISGAIIEERKATIEVTEILDVDRAACEIIDDRLGVHAGDQVRRCP